MVVQDKEAIGEGHGYGGFSPMEFRRTKGRDQLKKKNVFFRSLPE